MNDVTRDDLVAEGISWGVGRGRAEAIVDGFLDTAREAANADDSGLREVLTQRVQRISVGRQGDLKG